MANLNEAFVVSKTKDNRGNNVAFIDPSKPENKDTYTHYKIFKDKGANWSKSKRFAASFPPHKTGFWFWYIGKTKDQWKNVFDKVIKPALEQAHTSQGAPQEQSEESIVASLDALMGDVGEIETSPTGEKEGNRVPTPQEKKDVEKKLQEFKEKLVNLDSDEEMMEILQQIVEFKRLQDHPYSLNNTILIMIQAPNARNVKARSVWENTFNRNVNKDARPIFLLRPNTIPMKRGSRQYQETTDAFLQKMGVKTEKELSPVQKRKLNLKRKIFLGGYKGYAAYDVKDTTQMEGKEDLIAQLEKKKDIKWYEEGMLDDEVRPVYNALMDYTKSKGIEVELTDEKTLGGARGMSSGGKIFLLHNEGNDVGTTKTFVHELAHELLHQSYAKSKDKELEQYFLGREQGRELIEQQAELTAWMVMGVFGFDLKKTSLSYVALWGADKNKMVDVFDMVAKVANYLITIINERISKAKKNTSEGMIEEESVQPAPLITPLDVAQELGVEDEYKEELKKDEMKQEMVEHFYKLSGGKQIL
jgi:hypothetical protein